MKYQIQQFHGKETIKIEIGLSVNHSMSLITNAFYTSKTQLPLQLENM